MWNLLFGGKTITTKKIGEHSAVMTIDYFWGENMFALLLFLTKTGTIDAPWRVPVEEEKITREEWLAGKKEEDVLTKFIRLFRSGKLPVYRSTPIHSITNP